jgi:transposase
MAKDEYEELLELRKVVKNQQQQIGVLQSQVENLTQAILHSNKKLFGSSSEKTPIEGQISLFNEAECLSDSNAIEPTPQNIIVSTHKRTPRKPGSKEEIIKDLPRETIECVLEGEYSLCPYCAAEMVPIGKNIVRTEVEFIPASVKVIEYVQYSYKCPECGTADSSPDVIVKAPVPAPVMKRSLASPSTVAEVIYQKYVNGMPLYRQEQDWLQRGFKLSRSTMANWVIHCSSDWLKPIYELMKQELVKCESIHADETRIQCNKEPGKKASSQSFMWLYRSGKYEPTDIVIFEYTRTRAGKHAEQFLKGFYGYLITDAYAGYEKVENVIRC